MTSSSKGHDHEAREPRRESRQALAQLLNLLGYPEAWAVELEHRAYLGGHVWKVTG
jgi:hypothetical protein